MIIDCFLHLSCASKCGRMTWIVRAKYKLHWTKQCCVFPPQPEVLYVQSRRRAAISQPRHYLHPGICCGPPQHWHVLAQHQTPTQNGPGWLHTQPERLVHRSAECACTVLRGNVWLHRGYMCKCVSFQKAWDCPCGWSWCNHLHTCFNIYGTWLYAQRAGMLFIYIVTKRTLLRSFSADYETLSLMKNARNNDREDKTEGRGQKSKFYIKNSLINLTVSLWVAASWTEVNYSKRRRLLASACYYQENHQLCGGRFLISLTCSSAPEDAAGVDSFNWGSLSLRSNDMSSGFPEASHDLRWAPWLLQPCLHPAVEQIHTFTATTVTWFGLGVSDMYNTNSHR